MANFCKKCGSLLPEKAMFCGECGAPVSKEELSVTAAAPAAEKTEKALSLWAYVGLFLLFNLPFVGWIICIVMAFAPKNANIRHFAGGLIVYILILSLLSGILVALLLPVIRPVIQEVQQTFVDEFTGAIESLSPEEQAQLDQIFNGTVLVN